MVIKSNFPWNPIPCLIAKTIFPLLQVMVFQICLAGCTGESPKSLMEKQISFHLDQMEASAIDLENEMDKLSKMKQLNTAERLKKAVTWVQDADKTLARADRDVAAYIDFAEDNSRLLRRKGLGHFIEVKDILDQSLTMKRHCIGEYFKDLKRWLDYSARHFKRLKAGDTAARQSYDAYLIEVNRSLKKYNARNRQHIRFVNDFLIRNPELKKKFERQYKTMQKELGWI